ncbi:MAG: response regulator [Bacteroides sp.]|nr:response regulator [Bacteroides sp.]
MNDLSKTRMVAGYVLLLAVLFCSLFLVSRETRRLTRSDAGDVQWTDSLIALLHAKDENTLRMLRTLSEASENALSADDIERILEEQDTARARHRVQHRVIARRDTVVAPQRKKGFLRRLGEVFVPPREDTAFQVNTSTEYVTDTLVEAYNPADSLHERLRSVARQRQQEHTAIRRHNSNLQQMNRLLTARIDSLLAGYEQETLEQARHQAEQQQEMRHRSARLVGGIAIGAVLLAAVFLTLVIRDVSRSNRYRRQLEEARRRAEQLLATREQLMLAITHDFKAPLGSIMGYTDLFEHLTLDEQQRGYIDNIRLSSAHLQKLVTDLLDFHRLELNKMEVQCRPFSPVRLLEEVRQAHEPPAAAKGLLLQAELSSDLPSACSGDPLRLRQILDNLLSNAVKFTDYGRVTLHAGYAAGRLCLSVSDTGKGMAPEDCERIFQEFTRLPDAQGREGFGLGLSIVHRLVQLLGGTIRVVSQPGEGSTFTVELPLPAVAPDGEIDLESSAVPSAPTSLPSCPLHQPLAGKRVLLIDDDRIQLTLTTAMLQQGGLLPTACLTPDELFDALRTTDYDLLLTDVQMPAINGFDLLRLLRSSNISRAGSIPVVAVTARSDMQREDLLAHGFAGCLRKPFTLSELLAEVSSLFDLPPAPPESDGTPSSGSSVPSLQPDFDALTAFSANDSEASRQILQSFHEETRQHADRLNRAVAHEEWQEASAVAHKMIPLFTLIGTAPLVENLRLLESALPPASPSGASDEASSAPFPIAVPPVALREAASCVLAGVAEVLAACRQRLQRS